MKLYYAPGACSLAPHIVLREGGFDFKLEKVDLATKQAEHGENFEKINPKGYVPALRLDNGEVLTEAAVILQYLADQSAAAKAQSLYGELEKYQYPQAKQGEARGEAHFGDLDRYRHSGSEEPGLAPPYGTMQRYRLMEWLHFVSTELHKQFGPLFNSKITPEWRENQLNVIRKRLSFLAIKLNDSVFVAGDYFSIVDAYLFTVLNWCPLHKVELGNWPSVRNYYEHIAARPKVMEALQAEGLIR